MPQTPSQPSNHAEGRARPHAAVRRTPRKGDAVRVDPQRQCGLQGDDGPPRFREHGGRDGERRGVHGLGAAGEVNARDPPRPRTRRPGGDRKGRIGRDGVGQSARLPKTPRDGLVAHERRVMRKEIGCLAVEEALDTAPASAPPSHFLKNLSTNKKPSPRQQ